VADVRVGADSDRHQPTVPERHSAGDAGGQHRALTEPAWTFRTVNVDADTKRQLPAAFTELAVAI
jgi:hypothetical protein